MFYDRQRSRQARASNYVHPTPGAEVNPYHWQVDGGREPKNLGEPE